MRSADRYTGAKAEPLRCLLGAAMVRGKAVFSADVNSDARRWARERQRLEAVMAGVVTASVVIMVRWPGPQLAARDGGRHGWGTPDASFLAAKTIKI